MPPQRGGKRPTAPEVAEITGASARKNRYRRDDRNCPRADKREPEMPDYLDEYGREKWAELVADMKANGVLGSDCRELFIAYCVAYSGWRTCLEYVNKLGPSLIEVDGKGEVKIKKNHICVELHKYREQMNRLMPEFGLTPSARARVKSLNTQKEEDPFAMLLERLTSEN